MVDARGKMKGILSMVKKITYTRDIQDKLRQSCDGEEDEIDSKVNENKEEQIHENTEVVDTRISSNKETN